MGSIMSVFGPNGRFPGVGYFAYTRTPLGNWFFQRQLREAGRIPHTRTEVTQLNDITVEPIPYAHDNYGYLITNTLTREAVVVDPADAVTVGAAVRARQVTLVAILTTHRHADHSGGNAELLEAHPGLAVYGSRRDKVACVTHNIDVRPTIIAAGMHFDCIHVPGHTHGSFAFNLSPLPTAAVGSATARTAADLRHPPTSTPAPTSNPNSTPTHPLPHAPSDPIQHAHSAAAASATGSIRYTPPQGGGGLAGEGGAARAENRSSTNEGGARATPHTTTTTTPPPLPHCLFTGDSLFVAGCGRVFEGTYVQCHASLQKLAGLADSTLIFPGHEYGLINLLFAYIVVDKENAAVQIALREALDAQTRGRAFIPSTVSAHIHARQRKTGEVAVLRSHRWSPPCAFTVRPRERARSRRC